MKQDNHNQISSEVPPGFRMTELGPLPEEWEVTPFEKAILEKEIKVGKVKKANYKGPGKFPIIDQSQQDIAGYSDDQSLLYSGYLPVIIFGDHTRIFKFVDFPFICGADGTKVIVPNKEHFDPKFLYFSFLRMDLPNRGYNRHYSLLREKSIPLPPLPEQRAIARTLSTVQQAQEATERVIAAAHDLKRSLMQKLFTEGLDATAPKKETEVGEIPAHWEVAPLEEAAELIMGQSPRGDTYNTGSVGVPLINGPAEFGERFPVISKWTESPTKVCEVGDILFCVRGNTTGRMNVADACYCIGRGVAAIRGRRNLSETNFIFGLLQKEADAILAAAESGGSTFPNITKTELENLAIPLPPLSEQREIARILSTVDRKIEAEEKRQAALRDLFRTLLHELMTGQIRVEDKFGGLQ